MVRRLLTRPGGLGAVCILSDMVLSIGRLPLTHLQLKRKEFDWISFYSC